jgi:hypothetical protein
VRLPTAPPSYSSGSKILPHRTSRHARQPRNGSNGLHKARPLPAPSRRSKRPFRPIRVTTGLTHQKEPRSAARSASFSGKRPFGVLSPASTKPVSPSFRASSLPASPARSSLCRTRPQERPSGDPPPVLRLPLSLLRSVRRLLGSRSRAPARQGKSRPLRGKRREKCTSLPQTRCGK